MLNLVTDKVHSSGNISVLNQGIQLLASSKGMNSTVRTADEKQSSNLGTRPTLVPSNHATLAPTLPSTIMREIHCPIYHSADTNNTFKTSTSHP